MICCHRYLGLQLSCKALTTFHVIEVEIESQKTSEQHRFTTHSFAGGNSSSSYSDANGKAEGLVTIVINA